MLDLLEDVRAVLIALRGAVEVLDCLEDEVAVHRGNLPARLVRHLSGGGAFGVGWTFGCEVVIWHA